ncbi:YjcZ family sporulation protein [Paenibacillus sp. EC2-1]
MSAVEENRCGGYGGYGVCGGGYGSGVGAILVLFILLVIITRAFWV